MRSLLELFKWAVSFGVDLNFIPAECYGISGHVDWLILWMTAPVVLIASLVTVNLLRLTCTRALTQDRIIAACVPTSMTILFLAYPIVTTIAFQSFSCYRFEVARPSHAGAADGKYCHYLMADPAIECTSSYQPDDAVTSTAWLAILLYPIGVLVLTACLLWRARHAILHDQPTELSKALKFLYRDVQPGFYWWELMEMSRRLTLIGFLVVVEPGSMLQLVLGTTFAFIFFIVREIITPAEPMTKLLSTCLSSFSPRFSLSPCPSSACATRSDRMAFTMLPTPPLPSRAAAFRRSR